ncbi:hypothetical protein KIN13_05825, partial [Vibrio cholerae]
FPGLCFQTNEQRYVDHDVPPVVRTTSSCPMLSSKRNAIFADVPPSSSVAGMKGSVESGAKPSGKTVA